MALIVPSIGDSYFYLCSSSSSRRSLAFLLLLVMQAMRHQSSCRSAGGGGQQKWARSNEGWLRDSGSGSSSRDEDLALFYDMRTRERKNFLHPSNDDIEASLPTRFGGLTGFRISTSSTPPWKGNDLLATDSDKNDYDWLLTPPGTPLFPSLDNDSPMTYVEQSVLTQTHSASKVSRFSGPSARELHNKVSRRSPGPHTPTSTASSTSSTNTHIRGREPSPSRISPSPTLRPATPTRSLTRSATTLNRASTRSSPPRLRRLNTSPSVRSSSTERNAHPAKGRSRGASVSPKLRAWQPPELGFSAEPPPNLRTSISDRPLSSSRGTTLHSRPGTHVEARHSYSEAVDISQSRWRNSSSSGSRVSSSTTSQDRWSSKGSVISSSDDGTEVMEPTFLEFNAASPSPTLGNTKTVGGRFDAMKRQIRSTSSSIDTLGFSNASARKSLEPSMRRVDHHCNSQNMFRPLLSSAPTSSFYNVGHPVARHRPASPILEPSITASSNASSEQGVRIFPGNESSDEGEREIESKWDKSLSPGPAISKIKVNRDRVVDPEYIERQDYMDQFEQDSVTDSTSSPMGAIHGCEMDRIRNRNTLDSPEHAAFAERNQASHKAYAQGGDNYSFPTKFPISELEYGSVDSDSTGLHYPGDITASPHSQETADQVFVDIQEDLSMKYNGTQWQDCGSIDLHKASHGLDIPRVPTLNTSQTSNQPYNSDQERLQEATHEARYEPVIWSPQRQTSMPNCSDSKQSQSISLSMDPLVKESIIDASISTGKIRSNQAEYGGCLQTKEVVDPSLSTQPALLMNNTDSPERGHLLVGTMPKSSENVTRGSPLVDALSLERSHLVNVRIDSSIEPNISCGTQISVYPGAVECPLPTGASSKENWDECSNHGLESSEEMSNGEFTPRSQRQEGLLQPELASQDSCREYYIDMLETTENLSISGSETTNFGTPRKLLFVESGSDVDPGKTVLGENIANSQVSSLAVNLEEEVLEQLKKVVSLHEGTEATLSREEEEDTFNTAATVNPDALSSKANDKHHDVAMVIPVDQISRDSVVDGDELSGKVMAEKAFADISIEGFDPKQMEPQKTFGDGPIKTWVSVEGIPQSSDEVQQLSSAELLSMHVDSQETGLLAKNTHIEGQDDTPIQIVAPMLGEDQQQPHLEEFPIRTNASSGWKPATRNFSLEEATNTILFCSSIVHDMVYKAASIATEKEAAAEAAAAAAAPLWYQVRRPLPNADYTSSLRAKISRTGTWKGKHKEAKSSFKRSNKEETTNVPVAITQHPTPIEGMKKSDVREEAEKAFPTAVKEKSHIKLPVNSNCQCTIM